MSPSHAHRLIVECGRAASILFVVYAALVGMIGCGTNAAAPRRVTTAEAASPDDAWSAWPTRIGETDDARALFAGVEPCVVRARGQLDCIRGHFSSLDEHVVQALFAYEHADASTRDARFADLRRASPPFGAAAPAGLWTWARAPSPLDVPRLPPALRVERLRVEASGGCAILDGGGAVACWAMQHTIDAPLVTRMPDGERAVEVGLSVERSRLSCGRGGCVPGEPHACARLASGRVTCWGWNFVGQLGDGTRHDSDDPVYVQGIVDAAAIAVGMHHGCALHADGGISCWGYGVSGQLGDGGDLSRESPVRVVAVVDAIAISAGEHATCALGRDGRPRCWGEPRWFGVHETGDVPLPHLLPSPEPLVEIAVGGTYVCGRSASGHVYCGGSY